MWSRNLLFVISGPSGSGKTTLLQNLLKDKDLKHRLLKSISFTTRHRRSGEKQGRDYFFIEEEEFRRQLKQKKILEWTKFLNYYYGTSKSQLERLLRKGKHILLCLDEKGAEKIRQLFPSRTITVFILPPKMGSLKIRMSSPERKIDDRDILKRLSLAKRQIRLCKDYDYRIVNDDLRLAAHRLKDIIIKQINTRERIT